MVVGVASPFMFAQPVQAVTPVITPALEVNLMTREGNTLRIAWADLIAANLATIGIKADRVTVPKTTFNDRAMVALPEVRGKTYADGGFDIAFVGWAQGPEPGPFALYDSSQFPPTGYDYTLWNNTENDALGRQISTELNQTKLIAEVKAWQALEYSQIPVVTLHYTEDIVPMAPNLNSTQVFNSEFPRWPGVETWKYDSSPLTTVTLDQPQDGFMSLSPYHTTWFYDVAINAPIYGEGAGFGLLTRAINLTMVPYMASYKVNAAGTVWIFNITHGIKFTNGEELDARDVVYTVRYALSPAWGYQLESYLASFITSNTTVYWPGEAGTRGASFGLDEHAVIVNMTAPWGTFRPDFGGLSIFPASVLVNSSTGIPAYSAWVPNTHDMTRFAYTAFSLGDQVGSYKYYGKNGTLLTGTGPIGAGPYMFVHYDTTTGIVHLTKNPNYFQKAALEAKGEFGITDYYIKGVTSGPDAAKTDLKNGVAQVLDTNYQWGALVGTLDPSWSKYIVVPAYGCQEMGFNMQHPVLGTGLGTPVGNATHGLAAQAALDVRLAFEAMVPKQQIIDTLLSGFGSYGVTSPVTRRTIGFDATLPLRNYTSQAQATAAAIGFLQAAGYTFTYPAPPSFWEAYGLLLAIVELAVIVVLAGFYFFRPRAK